MDFLKNIIKKLGVFHLKSSKKNILIYSSPRSGSTWLLELIVGHSSGKSISEPFDLRKPLVQKYLKFDSWDDVINLDKVNEISDYLNELSIGKLSFKNLPLNSNFHKYFVDHSIIKILHGSENMMHELKGLVNARIVYLIRHPIPVSLSRKELPRLQSFLENIELFLPEKEWDKVWDIYNEKDFFQNAILDWCFQNCLPLKMSHKDVIRISYEQMVLDPINVLNLLKNDKVISDIDNVEESLSRPSKNSYKSNIERKKLLNEKNRQPELLIKSWMQKVDMNQISRAQEILDIFSIDYYVAKNHLPVYKN